jgi:hypothetical protein
MVPILKMVPMLNIVAISISNTAVIYHGILTLGNVGTSLSYRGILVILAAGACTKNIYRCNLQIFVIS